MSIATILLPLSGGDDDAVVAETALALAEPFGAHVRAIFVRGRPEDAIAFVGDGMSSVVINQIVEASRQEARDRGERAHQAFTAARSRVANTAASWEEIQGREEQVVAELGRLADLVVLGHPAATSPERGIAAVEAALFQSGRPILLIGSRIERTLLSTVAVAWNGSSEAARAVAGALPLLQQAGRVVVLSAGRPEEVRPSPDDFLVYLGRHGIVGSHVTLPAASTPIADQLVAAAREEAATLLVMGAYGHSRLRELVLGGVTRRVLANPDLPVMMAH